ncbi:MAG: winged helix-turn-helix transcriptional regulator [Candidatus Methylomirabilaceae bacterium]
MKMYIRATTSTVAPGKPPKKWFAAPLRECPARQALERHIKANPGINMSQARRALGMGWGAAIRHARILEERGVVTSRREGRELLLFPRSIQMGPESALARFLHRSRVRQIIDAVRGCPGIQRTRLAAATGMSPRILRYHLDRLIAQGLVEIHPVGARPCLFATLQLQAVFASLETTTMVGPAEAQPPSGSGARPMVRAVVPSLPAPTQAAETNPGGPGR